MSYKINCKKKIDPNLITVINFLNYYNIKYWLCHGSLLGLIRDKNLLSWDHDIDIAILKNSFQLNLIKVFMKKNGFKIIQKSNDRYDSTLKFLRLGGKEIDFNFYEKKKKKLSIIWPYTGNFFCKIVDTIALGKNYNGKYKSLLKLPNFILIFFNFLKKIMISNNLFFSYAGYCHDIKFINKLDFIKLNDLYIKVPNQPKKYLECLYGKEWRIKKKKFNWVKDSPATIKYDL